MAEFNKAWAITSKNEGGYDNDPRDVGGETYRGISRNNFPSWSGWKLIDIYKKKASFKELIAKDIDLQRLVISFYTKNFWDVIKGDEIKPQKIANKLFDLAVNTGIVTAVKNLQKALLLEDVDGIVGEHTLKAIDLCDVDCLLTKFKHIAEEWYKSHTKKCFQKQLINRLRDT